VLQEYLVPATTQATGREGKAGPTPKIFWRIVSGIGVCVEGFIIAVPPAIHSYHWTFQNMTQDDLE
jgi:hypothetical protein